MLPSTPSVLLAIRFALYTPFAAVVFSLSFFLALLGFMSCANDNRPVFSNTLVVHVSHYLLFFCLLFCASSLEPVHGLYHHIPLGFLIVFYHRIWNISECAHVLVPIFSLVLFLEIPLAYSSRDSKHTLLPGICPSNAAQGWS